MVRFLLNFFFEEIVFLLLKQDDVDKDLLSHELEQANNKLNWYNEKFKEYSDLQINLDLIKTENKQLENDLDIQQQTNKSNLERFDQYEKTISQLQQQIDQFNSKQSMMKNFVLSIVFCLIF